MKFLKDIFLNGLLKKVEKKTCIFTQNGMSSDFNNDTGGRATLTFFNGACLYR